YTCPRNEACRTSVTPSSRGSKAFIFDPPADSRTPYKISPGEVGSILSGSRVSTRKDGMKDGWKVAVAVRDDLAVWQKLNVTAFVISGVGTSFPELIGARYVDGSGHIYMPKLGLPVLVYEGDQA